MANRAGWFAVALALSQLPGLASADTPAPETDSPMPPPPPPEVATSPQAAPSPPPQDPPRAPSAEAPQASDAMAPIASPLRIEGKDGSIRLGLLLQPTYEALGSASADSLTQNLYLRRTRFLVGGTLLKHFEYFFETDYPNLFKGAVNETTMTFPKNSPGLNIQDAFATYKPVEDLFKIDAGYMLPPLAHNAVQGATTLYGWDYFSNSFRHSGVFGNGAPDPVGRDLGVQARGLLFDGHLEYRVGMFQGLRESPVAAAGGAAAQAPGRNFFRVAGRIQVNLLDAETGFFYSGTYLGAKRILSLGGAVDIQDDYKYFAGDAILDLPLGPGVVTAQVNVAQWDGGTFVALPKQTAIMGEAGYLILPIRLSPIVRFEKRTFATSAAATPDETRYAGGLAFWPYGHNSNLKAFYTHVHPDPALHDFDQFDLQWQIFFY